MSAGEKWEGFVCLKKGNMRERFGMTVRERESVCVCVCVCISMMRKKKNDKKEEEKKKKKIHGAGRKAKE